MIVRLHNLAARPLRPVDAKAITELLIASETAEFGSTDITEEDIQRAWQTPSFDLKTDAWSIVTRKGQLVGYADVRWDNANELLNSSVTVHPDYRNRGIGTLLIRLVEERARQLVCNAQPGKRVVLSSLVSGLNEVAHRLFEREGYTFARSFWRLSLESDEVQEQQAVDLTIDIQDLFGVANLHKRAGMYVARQYQIYEKELRADAEDCADEAAKNMMSEPLAI